MTSDDNLMTSVYGHCDLLSVSSICIFVVVMLKSAKGHRIWFVCRTLLWNVLEMLASNIEGQIHSQGHKLKMYYVCDNSKSLC